MIKMSKSDWSNVKESGGGKYLLDAGGYICAIKSVEDVPTNNYVKIEYDVVKGKDAKFFTNKFNEDVKSRGDKAFWGGYFTRSYDEQGMARWKSFITSLEKSNPGKFAWNPEAPDLSKMKNKYIGLVIGQREKQGNNGKVYLQNYVVATKSVESIENGDFQIPEVRKLDATKMAVGGGKADDVDFSAMFANDADSEPAIDPFANADSAPVADANPWDDSDVNPFA